MVLKVSSPSRRVRGSRSKFFQVESGQFWANFKALYLSSQGWLFCQTWWKLIFLDVLEGGRLKKFFLENSVYRFARTFEKQTDPNCEFSPNARWVTDTFSESSYHREKNIKNLRGLFFSFLSYCKKCFLTPVFWFFIVFLSFDASICTTLCLLTLMTPTEYICICIWYTSLLLYIKSLMNIEVLPIKVVVFTVQTYVKCYECSLDWFWSQNEMKYHIFRYTRWFRFRTQSHKS